MSCQWIEPYSCATCSAGGPNSCNSCSSAYFLHPNTGGVCINTCPTYYWGDTSTNKCIPCWSNNAGSPYSCKTCTSSANSACTSCDSGSFLHPNTGGECINPCPIYYWGETSTNKCQPCWISSSLSHFTCKTCTSSVDNACTSCDSGTFLHPNTGGQCISTCSAGYWADTSTNKCQICYTSSTSPNFTCTTCSAGGFNDCNSCNTFKFLHPNKTGGSCLSSCPYGYWGDTSRSLCLNSCPARYWPDNSTNLCQPCWESSFGPYYSCATCSEGANSNCNSCDAGSFLLIIAMYNYCPDHYWGDTLIQRCVNSCPDGYWPDNSTHICHDTT